MEKRSVATLPAKLTAPKVDRVVLRNRLFKQLDKAKNKSVIWVGAPAGSGKTTLVASYLAAHKIKPLWYQIDARDADPAAFFTYLRQAAGRLAPNQYQRLPMLSPECNGELPIFTLNFFKQLFQHLHNQAVLVFDNFQDLPEISPLHNLIKSPLSVLPDHMTLFFLSRTQPPPSFTEIIAAQRLACIDAESLRLTSEEAIAISRQIVPKPLEQEEIVALNTRADGWIAGLILLLIGAQTTDSRTLNADLFDYFAAEIMRRTDPQTQAFLTTNALLPVMNDASTARLTGHHRASELLSKLVKHHYFIVRLEGSTSRYKFHPLFRTFLLAQLEKSRSDEELQALYHEAGRILAEQGEYSAAVELLARAGALDEVQTLVLAHAERLVAQGQVQTLYQWIQTIPEQAYEAQPWLLYWYGVSCIPFDLLHARSCFERAYTLFENTADVEGRYLSWASIAEIHHMRWDEFRSVTPWLNRYEALRACHTESLSAQLEIRVLSALLGVLLFLRPHHTSCYKTCRALERLVNIEKDPYLKVRPLSNLNFYYLWSGNYTAAKRTCDIMEKMLETEELSPLSRSLTHIEQGKYFLATGDTKSAKEMLANAQQVCGDSDIFFSHTLIPSLLIYIHGAEKNLDKMNETLSDLKKKVSPKHRLDYARYLHQLSWYNSLKGEYALAVSQARESLELSEQIAAVVPTVTCQVELATNLIYLGEYTEAHILLDKAMAVALQMHGHYLEFLIKMVRTFAWLQQGYETVCSKDLREAFRLGAKQGYVLPGYTMDHRILSTLCEYSLTRNIETEFARLLICKWKLVPESITLTSDTWPWAVKIRTLGPFTLEINNQLVTVSNKRRSRTMELLIVLIALSGRDITEQEISDLLWPNVEGDLARQNLKVTLHRLRKLIGQENVLLNKGRLSLSNTQIWVDSWAFDRLLDKLETASDEQITPLATVAIERYGDGFMPGDETSWVLTQRERLRSRFLRIIGQVIERLCELGHWQTAINGYRKALETDPLAERFYTGLMRSHYALGQQAQGLIVYHRCQEILANELQIQPSSITETWRERLSNTR
jgi:ATP/maltotriose-dependent transcriptional regulator MalT/DNA-binding SARP family transcriptional activator